MVHVERYETILLKKRYYSQPIKNRRIVTTLGNA